MCSIYFANSVWASTRSFAQSPGVEPTDRERFYVLDPFGNYFEFIEMKNS